MTRTFTHDQVIHAIETWLRFGEETLGTAHKGYFSGAGWAAQVLREHLKILKQEDIKEESEYDQNI